MTQNAPVRRLREGGQFARSTQPGRNREQVVTLIAVLVVLGTIATAILLYVFAFDHVIPWIALSNPGSRGRSYSAADLVTREKLLYSRMVVIIIASELTAIVILARRRTALILKTFFTATASPLDLALFRVVVAWGLLREVNLSRIRAFSRLPSALQSAPWGMQAVLPHLVINERWATVCALLLLVCSLTCLIGLFSRTSAALCVCLGIYVLGLPQFYGKVDHYHHLLWFAAILALSPCGAVLGIDAIFAARKRANQGITEPPAPSVMYALPLRFVMLLVGIIYFFPGLWKLWESGFDWVLSDNLKYQLYRFWTWSYNTTWLPSFRIDQHPLLCRIGAASTVLFEMSFIFLMFFPALRKIAALEGVVFHAFSKKFMLISFASLQASYVALFDWKYIFSTIGRNLYRDNMLFFYDGSCGNCSRVIASLRVLDVFGRVTYVNVRGEYEARNEELARFKAGEPKSHAWAIVGDESYSGFRAYRAVVYRIPVLWPAIPFLYIWATNTFGRHLGRCATDSRACPPQCTLSELSKKQSMRPQLVAITALGLALVLANAWCGLNKIVSGWPFSCYPTFSSPPGTELRSLGLVAVNSSGKDIPVHIKVIPYHRLYGVYDSILSTKDSLLQRHRLEALWMFAKKADPTLATATSAKFYAEDLWTDPQLWRSNPATRQLLFELHVEPMAALPGQEHARERQ